MRDHMDGTTSSSLYELRLGREKFGKETHAYSVAWADNEVAEAVGYADKIIFTRFNSYEDDSVLKRARFRGDGKKDDDAHKYPWQSEALNYYGIRENPPVVCPRSANKHGRCSVRPVPRVP